MRDVNTSIKLTDLASYQELAQPNQAICKTVPGNTHKNSSMAAEELSLTYIYRLHAIVHAELITFFLNIDMTK